MKVLIKLRGYAGAKYHLGLCSPFIHSVLSHDFVLDTEGPDRTARMCRLIGPFAVRIRGPVCRYSDF